MHLLLNPTAAVIELGFEFIDCQLVTRHLLSMGAVPVPRTDYLEMLGRAIKEVTYCGRRG